MPQQNFTKPFEWILDNRYRWLFHVLFWLFMYSDEFLALLGITSPLTNSLYTLVVFLLDVVLVYFSLYFLVPKLLLKNKFWLYISLTILAILINIGGIHYLYSDPEYESYQVLEDNLSNFVSTATLLGTAIAIKVFKLMIQEKSRRLEAENASLETELTYLKDQINPHFLFNALNNIYVQVRKRPQEASESVLLLSDLLRYQLYDCAKGQVYLNGEIEYLKTYLELDKMRKTGSDTSFKVEGTPNGKMIAPYIFLPFIENAIKHGTSVSQNAFIHIFFKIKENQILFSVHNSKPEQASNHPAGGIGLVNVQRRLDLLYKGKYDLQVHETKEDYKVELALDI